MEITYLKFWLLKLLQNTEFKSQSIENSKNIDGEGGVYLKQCELVNRKPARSLLYTQDVICCVEVI